MKTPARLQALVDEGLIDSVVRQLMSGKEANVYVVRCGDDTRLIHRRWRPGAALHPGA